MSLDIENGPVIVDNFIPEDIAKDMFDEIEEEKWAYGNSSNDDGIHLFWHQPHYVITDNFFSKCKTINKLMPDYIKKYTKINSLKLTRIHANGQTYGQDGGWHRDTETPNFLTCLIYLTPEVNKYKTEKFSGPTEFKIDENRIISIPPVYRRAVFFKSNILHRGTSFDRYIPHLRISVAFLYEIL